jgi:hypothetical protein
LSPTTMCLQLADQHYKKPCNLWQSIFITDHPIFVIKWHLWRNFISSWIERHKSALMTN